jgi:hypothetical protein
LRSVESALKMARMTMKKMIPIRMGGTVDSAKSATHSQEVSSGV